MMTDDPLARIPSLISDLREASEDYDDHHYVQTTCREAADALESAQARIAELEARRTELLTEAHESRTRRNIQAGMDRDRIADAECRVEIATRAGRNALDRIAELTEDRDRLLMERQLQITATTGDSIGTLVIQRTEAEQRAERAEAELADLRHNLALRAFTAPDATDDMMLESLDARIRDALAPDPGRPLGEQMRELGIEPSRQIEDDPVGPAARPAAEPDDLTPAELSAAAKRLLRKAAQQERAADEPQDDDAS